MGNIWRSLLWPYWLWKMWQTRQRREKDAIIDAANEGDLVAMEILQNSGDIQLGVLVHVSTGSGQ